MKYCWIAFAAFILAHMPGHASGFQLEEATIASVHAALQEGRLTCVQLVTAYLDRIDRLDRSSGLNAIVVTNPGALDEAAALDARYASTGAFAGAMHCVPVIVKDNYDTEGIQTTAGSVAMAGNIPAADAAQVRKLREAGAIVLAKSNVGEWAVIPFRNISSILGETPNAYDLAYPSAGSSGGTASAIAANFGLVGLGTDTGSSIRGPASHLALVGLRPTIGLASRAGIVPQNYTRDVGGPMTRTVEDAACVLEVIAGPDPGDPMTLGTGDRMPERYTKVLDPDALKGARIGVLRVISDAATADPEILALFNQALADLEALGATVVDPFEVPGFAAISENLWCNTFRHDLEGYLAAAANPPVRSLQEIYESGLYTAQIKNYLEESLAVTGSPAQQDPPCTDHLTDPRRIRFREAVLTAMDDAGVTLIAYPTWSNPPRPIADFGGPFGNNSSRIAPHTGQPAITVPMGFNAAGIPVGLQFLGRMFDESGLLAAAYAYEQATRRRRPPEAFRIRSAGGD